MAMTVVLRTAEEILEGAAHLKASSGEIVEEEDCLIQAETRPRRGPTGGKATQETTLHMAGLTPGHFSPRVLSKNSCFFSSQFPRQLSTKLPSQPPRFPTKANKGFPESWQPEVLSFFTFLPEVLSFFLIFFFFARGFIWNKTQN